MKNNKALITILCIAGIFYIVGSFPDNIRLLMLLALACVVVGLYK